MNRATRIGMPVLAMCMALPFQAHAFSEDLCVGLSHGRLNVENCLLAEHCDTGGEPMALCRANVIFDAGIATKLGGQGAARSMIHMDATFFIAQAVGLTPQAAYWLAAYDEVADVAVYAPFDFNGRPVQVDDDAMPVVTALLNGWSRSSSATGGFPYHIPPASKTSPDEVLIPDCSGSGGPTICGMYPDLTDSVHEGMLVHMRDWAFGLRAPCVNGITEQAADGGYYMGDQCYKDDPRLLTTPEDVPMYIEGQMPTLSILGGAPLPFCAYSGRQIAKFVAASYLDPDPTNNYPTEIQYADDLGTILSETYGGKLSIVLDGNTLEEYEALVRIGLYVHVLQDRISHYACGDSSYVSGPDGNGKFNVVYDESICTQDKHAYGHYQEVGHDSLPERDYTALEYTWDEIDAFADAYPAWKDTSARSYDKSQAVEDLIGVLKESNGCRRLKAMIALIRDYGFEQMPGNEECDLSRMCEEDSPPEPPTPVLKATGPSTSLNTSLLSGIRR